jgi:hypothetical protein
MRILSFIIVLTAAVACSHAPVSPVSTAPTATWVTPVNDDVWVVRVLTADHCPKSTKPRYKLNDAFPEQVCEMGLVRSVPPPENLHLPPLKTEPKRIVIFGDTGCRIKITDKKAQIQACNDPASWPFPKVAKAAAAWKPDLVIHVGDYHYRDADCPKDHPECAGTVPGDNLTSWKQDFFQPAAPLLAAAPWIFVRGNHEDCEHGGTGWFHFFDLNPYTTCIQRTSPRTVSFPGREFLIVDSAYKENIEPSLQQAARPREHTWLVTHRPLLTKGADIPEEMGYKLPKDWDENLSALFVGHVHLVSLNRFHDKRPPEFILGNGGSSLAESGQTPKQKREADETEYDDFGFTTLESQGGTVWEMVVHNVDGKDMIRCRWDEAVRSKKGFQCVKL